MVRFRFDRSAIIVIALCLAASGPSITQAQTPTSNAAPSSAPAVVYRKNIRTLFELAVSYIYDGKMTHESLHPLPEEIDAIFPERMTYEQKLIVLKELAEGRYLGKWGDYLSPGYKGVFGVEDVYIQPIGIAFVDEFFRDKATGRFVANRSRLRYAIEELHFSFETHNPGGNLTSYREHARRFVHATSYSRKTVSELGTTNGGKTGK
jgi:hypothetical protein